MASSLGNLIPLGQKSDKSSKKDDLTGGVISIGGKPKPADDNMDDFDLDDLLSDTPKPSSKSSPKKPKKSKDKTKKKKKDKGNDLDDSTSPVKAPKSTFTFDDDDDPPRPPKPKTSMKSLDDEFAKALGFDESEFRSSTVDSPEKPIEETKPPSPVVPPSTPAMEKGISASFFDEPSTDKQESFSGTSTRDLFGDRPKGRGRRTSFNDDEPDPFAPKEVKASTDPFSNPVGRQRDDPFGNASKRGGRDDKAAPAVPDPFAKTPDDKRPPNDDIFHEKTSPNSLDKGGKSDSIFEDPFGKTPEVSFGRGGRGRRGGTDTNQPPAEATPTFPWMKAKATPPVDVAEESAPTFPWMQKKAVEAPTPTPDEVKVEKPESKMESDLPAFPWVKKKSAEPVSAEPRPTEKKEAPKPTNNDDDLPAFPWVKKAQSEAVKPPEPVVAPPQQSPPKPAVEPAPAPTPPPEAISPSFSEQLPPPVVPVAKPDSPVRATFQLDVSDLSNSPPRQPSPLKDPSPRRPSASPAKLNTSPPLGSDSEAPAFDSGGSRNSPEKKPASPPRPSFVVPPTVDEKAKPSNSSPKRASPSSRASFLNDDASIVPAFVTNQLAQSQDMVATLTSQLSGANAALTTLQTEHATVAASLAAETALNQTLTNDLAVLRQSEGAVRDDLARAVAESDRRLEQLNGAMTDKHALSQELVTLRVQVTELGPLQALVKELQLENGALRGQLSSAQASLSACQRDLVKEQSLHAQSVERFQRMQHEREQEALHQQRWQVEEQRHAEKDALERLLTQVRAAVSGLKVLQENVVGGKSELEMRALGENETRARVLLDMEGSCKAFMNRSQEECHRLQALLNAMEGTMRTLRGEHMEEKERLRAEQSRLDELALHFQSQTTLLQERTDSNTRVVTQTLSAYIQDIRVAEARLHTRREQLTEEERQLHFARAAFAAQQEEALRDQRLTQEKIHLEHKRLDEKLHRVRQETSAFEELVRNHSDEMEALAAYQLQLEGEKERLQAAAGRVEEMAQKVRAASEQSAAMEAQAKDAMRDAATLVSQVQDERSRVQKQAGQLDEREKRLHEEMRCLMDTNRRRQHAPDAARAVAGLPRRRDPLPTYRSPPPPPVAMPAVVEKPFRLHRSTDASTWRGDPTGLSPSFRQEMEQFWARGNQVEVDEVRNHMLLASKSVSSKQPPRPAYVPVPRTTLKGAFTL